MSFFYSILMGTPIFFGLALVTMVLLQQTSNSGLLSNSSTHFAPGSLDAFKNKIIFILVVLFIGNILLLWVVRNQISKPKQESLVEKIATEIQKAPNNIVPIDD